MSKSHTESKYHKSTYWKGRPVMKSSDIIRVASINQIKSNTEMEKYGHLKKTSLPTGYEWGFVNICDDDMVHVCDYLNMHYCRGSDSEYVIKYSVQHIQWEMCNRGYFLTVLDQANKIVGVIGFAHRVMLLEDYVHNIVEPMYMCCEKKYRGTGIAKVLMDETIRRSSIMGIHVGAFCTNVIVSKPIATIRQYSRPINYKKLREHDFIEIAGIDDEIAHAKTKINLKPNKQYIVAQKTEENINIVHKLYKQYMETFNVSIVLTKNEIENYMFNNKYVKTLLVMSDNNNESKVVDFITYNFYDLVNTNKKDGEDRIIKVANILMYSALNVRPELLMINVLKQISFDKIHVVYVNDMMHTNEAILSNVKNGDEDTENEEESAMYDMNLVKTNKKTFLNLFNIESSIYKQTMVSWLLF